MRKSTRSMEKLFVAILAVGCLANGALFVHQFLQPAHARTLMASWQAETPVINITGDLHHTTQPAMTESQHSVSVPIAGDGKSLAVRAMINGQETGKFILDTGATYTTISRDMALRMGYDLENCHHIIITTANGDVSIPKIKLKSLTMNGYTAHNVDATVMNLPSSVPFQGLIGLSFIKNHRVTIDTAAQQLVIEPQTQSIASR